LFQLKKNYALKKSGDFEKKIKTKSEAVSVCLLIHKNSFLKKNGVLTCSCVTSLFLKKYRFWEKLVLIVFHFRVKSQTIFPKQTLKNYKGNIFIQ